MPVHRDKSANGYYSNFWKGYKKVLGTIENVSSEFIISTVSINDGWSDRMIIKMSNGFVMNSPFDLSKVDFKIIQLHLEAKALTL